MGEPVTWQYTVTNTGNVPLSNISVTDDQGVSPIYVSGDTDNDDILDLDETWIYEATGAAVAGAYSNTGTASGEFGGMTATDTDPSSYFGTAPALSLDKTATPTIYDAVDDVISYSYLVTNSGNVSLLGPVTVADDKADDKSCPDVTSVGNGDAYLDPGESITCTASYTITQADLNAGSVTNIATASAGGTSSDPDTETVNALQNPALTLVKTASPTTYDAVDDVISYSYLVTNTGNMTAVRGR